MTRKRTRHGHYPKVRHKNPTNRKADIKAFYSVVSSFPMDKIISIDETSLTPFMFRPYSRCPLGDKCIATTDNNDPRFTRRSIDILNVGRCKRITKGLYYRNMTVMLYSFQYAGQFFTDYEKDDFQYVEYGVPSIYGGNYQGGNCNYTKICNIDWWDWWVNIFPLHKILLGITVGTWDAVKQYEYGGTTVENSGFGGYIEWIYNLSTGCMNTTCADNPNPNVC